MMGPVSMSFGSGSGEMRKVVLDMSGSGVGGKINTLVGGTSANVRLITSDSTVSNPFKSSSPKACTMTE